MQWGEASAFDQAPSSNTKLPVVFAASFFVFTAAVCDGRRADAYEV
jgi:hypothetical protein